MNCEIAYFLIDLQILGPKNMRPWLHIHFNLALAQAGAEEEHPSDIQTSIPFPALERPDTVYQVAAKVLVSAPWSQGDCVAVAIGKTGLNLCQI